MRRTGPARGRSRGDPERQPPGRHGDVDLRPRARLRRSRSNEERLLQAIDAALLRIEDGSTGSARVRPADPRGAPGGAAVDDALHRLQAPRGTRVSEPAPRTVDVRVGSSDRRADAGLGRGALAGGRPAAVAGPGRGRDRGDRGRPGDEADRLPAARARRLGARDRARSRSTTCRTPGSRSGSSRARRPWSRR